MFDPMWLWIYAGCFLMIMELAAPGFIIFFFGLSAATVGAIGMVVGDAFSVSWQVGAFSFFSVLYLVVVRRQLKKIFAGRTEVSNTDFDDEFAGRTGSVIEPVVPGRPGRVLVGDAEWSAVADAQIDAGKLVKIVSRKNLTLKVEELK